MAENLQKKTFTGIIWSYVNQFGNILVSLIPAMILTRILSPSEYGLIAMTGIFTGIAYQLADGGFGNALVQKKDADHLDYCSVFYFNLCICSFIYLLLYILAPTCASFFNEDRLISIIRVSGLGIILLSIGQIHGIIFKKNIEYRKPAIRNFFVQIVSVIIAITLAFNDYGVWALVIQGLVQTALGSFVNWFISDWRPTWCFSFGRLKSLFDFGSKRLLASMIDYGFNKGYDITIGKFYTPANLAVYNRAYSTESLFSGTFFGVFSGITFPVFVQMQDDNDRLRYNIRRFLIICSMFIFTIMLTLIVLAEPLFHFLYSSKWDETIPFFRIVCMAGLFTPIVSILESVLLAKGEAAKFLYLSIIRKILIVIVILVTFQFGIIYMIIGQVFLRLIDIILLSHYINQSIRYNITQIIKDLTPYLLIALVIACIIYGGDKMVSMILNSINTNELFSAVIRLAISGLLTIFLFIRIYKSTHTYGYQEMISFLENVLGDKFKYIHFMVK